MKNISKSILFASVFLTLTLTATSVFADWDNSAKDKTTPVDPIIEQAKTMKEKKDWTAGAALLKDAIAKQPMNSEYHKLYAYMLRKSAKPDMDLVFKQYAESLKLDPKNRGAHEYVGEAYLMVNNLNKAKEHLASLEKLCSSNCDEYAELKNAINQYETEKK